MAIMVIALVAYPFCYAAYLSLTSFDLPPFSRGAPYLFHLQVSP